MSLADSSKRNQQANREKIAAESRSKQISAGAVDAYLNTPISSKPNGAGATKSAYDFTAGSSTSNGRPAYNPDVLRVSEKIAEQEQERNSEAANTSLGSSRAEAGLLPEDDETGGSLYRKKSRPGVITLEKPVVLYPGSFEGIEQEGSSQARFKFRFKVSPVPTGTPLVVTVNFFQTPPPPEGGQFGNAPQDPIDPDTGLPDNPIGGSVTVTIPAVEGEDLEKYPAGIYSEWIESSAYTKDPVTPTGWTVTIGNATGGGFSRITRTSRATFRVEPYRAVASLTSVAVWRYSGNQWIIDQEPENWELNPIGFPKWYWKGDDIANWEWNPTKEDWEWTGSSLQYPENIPSNIPSILPPPTPNRPFPSSDDTDYVAVVLRGVVDKPIASRVGSSEELKLKIQEEYFNSNNNQSTAEVGEIAIPPADVIDGPWRFVLASNGWEYLGSSNTWFWHTQEKQWLYSGESAGEWQWKLVDLGPNGYQDGWTWEGPGYAGKEWDWDTQSWKNKEQPGGPGSNEPPGQPVSGGLPMPSGLTRPPVARPPILPPYLGRPWEGGGVGKLTFFVDTQDVAIPDTDASDDVIEELFTRYARIESADGGGYSLLDFSGRLKYKTEGGGTNAILLVPLQGPINANGELRGKSTIRGADLFVKNYWPYQINYRPPVFVASGGPDNQPYVEASGQLIEEGNVTRDYTNAYFASAFIAGNGAYTAYVPSDGSWGEWVVYVRGPQAGNLDGQPFSLVDKRKYDEFTLEAWMRNAQPGVEMGNIFSASTVRITLAFKDALAPNPNHLRAFMECTRRGPGYYGNVVTQNWFQLIVGRSHDEQAFVEHLDLEPTTARPLGEWQHFALVKSRTSCDFFLDGQPLAPTNASNGPNSGSIQSNWDRFGPVVGTLSLQFYNYALPAVDLDPAGKFIYEPLAPPSPSAIHGLRFTSKALYSGPFTPPTSITTLFR